MKLVRIAKLISDRGYCSRRKAEELIAEARVFVDDKIVNSPAEKYDIVSSIFIDRKKIADESERPRLWLYYKPVGLITTHKDPQNRPTIFETLEFKNKVISVGRLDINSEGLLLLTNNGPVARYFELPKNNIKRSYIVRVFGAVPNDMMLSIKNGLSIDGINYRPIDIEYLENELGARRDSRGFKNQWFKLTLTEGKNREIRKIFTYFGMQVNKLIRISYGSYELGDMKPGDIKEIKGFQHEFLA